MAKTQFEIIAYHDETAQTGPNGNLSGHILYFVPRRIRRCDDSPSLFGPREIEYNPQDLLLAEISRIVTQAGLSHHKFHFTTRSGTKWTKYAEAYRSLIRIGIDSLRHKQPKLLQRPAHCKMAVIFYPSGVDVSVFGGEASEQYLRHDETIIRWLLKGALHRLFDEDHEVELVGVVSDGDPHHRSLDEWRILERMQHDSGPRTSKLREYVSVNGAAQIVHLSSDPKNHRKGRALEHCAMIQMADLLFGAVRRAYFVDISHCSGAPTVGQSLKKWKKKDYLAVPARTMLQKRNRGYGFQHSGHFNTFSVSKVDFTEHGPRFTEIPLQERKQSFQTLFDM